MAPFQNPKLKLPGKKTHAQTTPIKSPPPAAKKTVPKRSAKQPGPSNIENPNNKKKSLLPKGSSHPSPASELYKDAQPIQEDLEKDDRAALEHPSNDKHSFQMGSSIDGASTNLPAPLIDPTINTMDPPFHPACQDKRSAPEPDAQDSSGIPAPSTDNMQQLQEIFGLDNYHRRKALEILKMPTGALSALVFGALAIVQDRALQNASPASIRLADPAGPSTAAVDHICEIAKQDFLQPNVDCYGCGRYKLGMGDCSLLYLTMKGVEGLSDDFKRDHLPPGFLKHDPVAQSMVLGVVRDITKHLRGNI
ncbi:hypothetical protein PCANC_25840 [Puccinia coronata f. sp. avenae]|uniref:Uncharacterized protein n=1 Tax=Puccinia coronata f. sp. avenae TaxID=200324 RepID=A0A2N5TPG4_9BASI|nr:hypothetical protein PCANC_25840 [Puccinia coronata f. sp. avenae]